ncbi:Nitroreductase-like protein [Lipomyces tetrasporus]|uniref:Nitroreductase-like protein n=1 Tax=Lipomyces tetrasporus TaxID=54092 RepID=A0AAD7QKK3_9ASCO|nr:Nitroreductase-like protein [Lipomyces tetrasporus]KAJ8096931.1 Nitroreductase-like protein [Lipomyces tetrasporus]
MTASKTFFDAACTRRTYYKLTNKSTIPDSRIVELVNAAVLNVPSSFNSQSTRLVVLLKEEHQKLWEIAKETLKAMLPADAFVTTEQRLNGFQNAYGTILFFESPEPVKALQEKLPMYADRFPMWSEHASAMHQFFLWTALEAEGLGANLQHYNPLIDERVSTDWNVPAEWSLKAQLVFGTPTGEPMEKTYQPLKERVFVHGL